MRKDYKSIIIHGYMHFAFVQYKPICDVLNNIWKKWLYDRITLHVYKRKSCMFFTDHRGSILARKDGIILS